MYVLLEFQPQSRQHVPQHRKNHAWNPVEMSDINNFQNQILKVSQNKTHESWNTLGWNQTPKKWPKTYDPHSALHPIPPLVGSPAFGFLIVAALATLLPFAEVPLLAPEDAWKPQKTQQPEHRFEIKDPANWHPCQPSPPKIHLLNSDPKMIKKKKVFLYIYLYDHKAQSLMPTLFFPCSREVHHTRCEF